MVVRCRILSGERRSWFRLFYLYARGYGCLLHSQAVCLHNPITMLLLTVHVLSTAFIFARCAPLVPNNR